MNRILSLGLIILLFHITHLSAQSQLDYKNQWAKVDSLVEQNLTRSALTQVQLILADAKAKNNDPQFIKALLHELGLRQNIEEKSDSLSIKRLSSEIQEASGVRKAILHSLLAGIYNQYFVSMQWQISQRTEVDTKPEDFQTWDSRTFAKTITEHYLRSLGEKQLLQSTAAKEFAAILTRAETSEVYRPTLYDILGHQAIDYFLSNNPYLTEPEYVFQIPVAEGFADMNTFVNTTFSTEDETATSWLAIQLFQDLLRFHLRGEDPSPLVDLDLKRLRFVHNQVTVEDKDQRLLQAYEALAEAHQEHPIQGDVWVAIAERYENEGRTYNVFSEDQSGKDTYRKAMELCLQTRKKYPESRGAKKAAILISKLKQKGATLSAERINLPNAPFRVHLQYRNITQAYFRVIRYNDAVEKRLNSFNYNQQKQKLAYLRRQAAIHAWSQKLIDDGDLHSHGTEIKVNALAPGRYLILCSDHSRFTDQGHAMTYMEISVSALSYYMEEKAEEGAVILWALDRKSGKPLAGITIEQHEQVIKANRKREWVKRATMKTDANGRLEVTGLNTERTQHQFRLIRGKDELRTNVRMYYYGNAGSPSSRQQVSIFTDRAIYRPGQTIYFKGIVMQKVGEEHTILADKTVSFTLFDANSQEVSQLSLTTNEYGSVSGQFIAPTAGLTGRMRIACEGGNHTVRVEEYKRPTFEVKFEPIEGEYQLNEQITVNGKGESFSGAPISGADVKYRVVRRARLPIWRGWWGFPTTPSSPEREIANGTIKTDDQGKFKIEFTAEPDLSISPDQTPIFTYVVYADVVDITGETRSGNANVRLGYSPLEISISSADKIEKTDPTPFQLTTNNLNGNFQPAKGSIEIVQILTPKINFRKRQWGQADRQVIAEREYRRWFPHDVYASEDQQASWETGTSLTTISYDTEVSNELTIEALRSAPPGMYKAIMKVDGEEKLMAETYFTLFNQYQKQVPVPVWLDVNLSKEVAEPGDTIDLSLTTSERSLWALVQISSGKTEIENKMISLGRGTTELPIMIQESYRGGMDVSVTWFCENGGKTEQKRISVPWTNRELSLKWASFRSPLQPGQEEQWKLTIRGPKAEAVAAEMVATLYDASLDEFATMGYGMYLNPSRYTRRNLRIGGTDMVRDNLDGYNWNQPIGSFYQSYQELEWFDFHMGYSRRGRSFAVGAVMPSAAPMPKKGAQSSARPEAEYATFAGAPEADMEEANEYKESPPPPPQDPQESEASVNPPIRSNLNETAFFFPQLQTNEQGEIILNFTMPEALTRWKFLGLAHTRDLKVGTLTGETVTQKDLMLVPNLPRFFREEDEMTIAAKLVNLSDAPLLGTAELRLFDALTNLPVDNAFANTQKQQSFSVNEKGSSAIRWEIAVPKGVQAVTVQVIADAGTISDGEEHILPVLSNRMLVTESRPFSIRGKKKKQEFNFPKLLASNESQTLTHHKLTLELTSNPAWHAVQSLPYLMEFPHLCTEQIFSRFYANSLGSHIANSTPQIQHVFKQWQSLPDQKSLLSQLEQNQELKTALLTETPWVLEAQSQSERKRHVGMLFDLNRMADELQSSYAIIQQRQSGNGGFSWFPGMPESRYITTLIASGLGHLQKIGVNHAGNPEVGTLIQGALGYLDRELMNDHARLLQSKAKMDENHLGYWHIQYLYMRSFHKDVPVLAEAQKAFEYYYGQSKTYWNKQSFYMQGMLSLVFHRYEDQQLGQALIKGLRENAVFSQELGMYWKNPKGWYWYQAPIETQALMIEAFHEVSGDIESVEEMKVWLLQNKRTNDWGTTKATVAACNALLLTGENMLQTEDMVRVSLGGEEIDPYTRADASVEAGTGHFTTSWLGSEVKPEMGEIEVRRKGKGLAWGAVYWQYFEQMDKITTAETPLSIQKSLFIEKASDKGPVLNTITEDTPIKPGDKVVVRIEVRVDRDMEYVHLKDMRAAGFEPINVLSQYKYQDGLGYYESTRDAATHFFMDRLPKGTWVLEYPVRATLGGDFSNGITTLQCMYAPEFSSHSEGIRVQIK